MRTRTELREDDLTLLRQEELHAPETVACKGFCHLICHVLSLLQGFVTDMVRHPALAVITAFLHVTNRWAEDGRRILLSDGEKRKLRIEVDKLLDDNLLHIAASFLHGIAEGLLQLVVVVDITLPVAGRRHQRLDDTGESYLIGSLFELIEGLGVEVLRRAQS